MAQTGTAIDLAKQPATQIGLWRVLMTAIVIVAIGVGMVTATSFIAGSNRAPAADHSYDKIESVRGATTLSGVSVDGSYDKIESVRGGALLFAVPAGGSDDESAGLQGRTKHR